jgi:hypothetical protein
MRSRHRRFYLPVLSLPVFLLVSPADAAAAECRYDIVVSDAMASELDVTIECDGGLPASFVMTEGAPAWAGAMTLSDGDVDVVPDGERWLVPPGTRDGTAHYTIALRAMAETMGRYVSAFRMRESIVADPDAWLALPEPGNNYTVSIRFELPHGGDIATSLPFDGDRYQTTTNEVRGAGPMVFGTFDRFSLDAPAPGSLADGSDKTTTIDLVIVGDSIASSREELTKWVATSARASAEFWRGFPIERPLLILIPADGNKVMDGRVESTGGVTIVVEVGHETDPADLYQDWILIHEMLHLGSPYISDTGAWLNEGTATFYEPIVRMRAGWKTREEVWKEWIEWMPNGLRAMGEVGLAEAEGGGIYWGGALFLLLAEIEVRQRTDLVLGVEDCLRAVRDAGGTTDANWTTFKFAEFCDESLGGITVRNLLVNHLRPGEPPDLDALWAELGVSMDDEGTIHFDDSTPLAAVRDAILSGGPNAKWQPVPLRTE